MAYMQVKDLTNKVLQNVGLVSGTAVQTYTEPLVRASIQDIFDMLFQKRFWDHLTDWYQVTLDGVNGLFTTDIDSDIKEFSDIAEVWNEKFSQKLVKPSSNQHLMVTGGTPLYYTPIKYNSNPTSTFVKKVIQIWPKSATGIVQVRARTKPDEFFPTDIVPFPSHIIAMGAAWMLLDSDGINPTAASKCQQLFDILYRDYISSFAEDDIDHGGGRTNVPLTIRPL